MKCLKCNTGQYKTVEVSKCLSCGDIVFTHDQSVKLDEQRRGFKRISETSKHIAEQATKEQVAEIHERMIVAECMNRELLTRNGELAAKLEQADYDVKKREIDAEAWDKEHMAGFHAGEGIFFRRYPQVVQMCKYVRPIEGDPIQIIAQMPHDIWCSIVATVSKRGETGETWTEAKEFHNKD